MFADTACHWTAQNGHKLQHVAVKVLGLVFSVTPHSMHAMGFILTKAFKKTCRTQIGHAAGPDGQSGATWGGCSEYRQCCRKLYIFGYGAHDHALTTAGDSWPLFFGRGYCLWLCISRPTIARPVNQGKEVGFPHVHPSSE